MSAFEAGSGDKTHIALRNLFGVGKSNSDLLEIVSIIVRRMDRVIGLIPSAPHFDASHQANAIKALKRLQQMFEPDHLTASWKDTRAIIHEHGHLQTVHFLSPALKNVVRYSVPSAEERAEFIRQIDEALSEFGSATDIGADALVGSLKSLRLILEKLDFFGIEELQSKLVLATANFKVAVAAVDPSPRPDKTKGAWRKLAKIAVVLAGIANAIVLADDAPTAITHHYDRALHLAHWVSYEVKPLLPPPRQLPAPPPKTNSPDKAENDSTLEGS
jgi:hypothetical protein